MLEEREEFSRKMDEVVESVLRGGRLKVKGMEVMRRAWLGLGVSEKCLDFVKRMETFVMNNLFKKTEEQGGGDG